MALTAASSPRVIWAWSLRFSVASVSEALFQFGFVGLWPTSSSWANSAVYPSDQKGPSSPHPHWSLTTFFTFSVVCFSTAAAASSTKPAKAGRVCRSRSSVSRP